MHFDWTYLLLVLPAMIFAMIASAGVNSTFAKYSKQYSSKGVTGAQAARLVLDRNGLQHIPIEMISGKLTDHYDPTANVIRVPRNSQIRRICIFGVLFLFYASLF